MAKVEGLSKLLEGLAKRASRAKAAVNVEVTVGYSAPYALFVHEDVEMVLLGKPRPSGIGGYWDAFSGRGNAKFLEGPARRLRRELCETVKAVIKRGSKGLHTYPEELIGDGLKAAGELLLSESRKEVPYEYGDLYNSGFVKVDIRR